MLFGLNSAGEVIHSHIMGQLYICVAVKSDKSRSTVDTTISTHYCLVSDVYKKCVRINLKSEFEKGIKFHQMITCIKFNPNLIEGKGKFPPCGIRPAIPTDNIQSA